MMHSHSGEDIVSSIFALFGRLGGASYGEAVTQLEHALQCAHRARTAGESDPLVAAALLHDIGHLLQKQGENAADRGVDAFHELIGAAWLSQGFGPLVADPVRLHVQAKRYLARREPGYLESLSSASRQSLVLQGGPMTESEADAFVTLPSFEAAVRLRRYDELGKIEGQTVAPLETYRDLLLALVNSNEASVPVPQKNA